MWTMTSVEDAICFATCVSPPPPTCVDSLRMKNKCNQKEGVTLKLQYPMLMRKHTCDVAIMQHTHTFHT